MRKNWIILVITLFSCVQIFFPSTVLGELSDDEPVIISIQSTGSAPIIGGKVERSRLNALRYAYARAAQRASDLKGDNILIKEAIKDLSAIVASRSRGFVTAYSIVNEGISERDNTLYEMVIQASVVDRGEVRSDARESLKLYLELLDNPRLMVFISETSALDSRQNVASGDDMASIIRGFETVLAHHFTSYGYQVITSDDVVAQNLARPDTLAQAKAGVTARAVEIGRMAGVDLILVGTLALAHEQNEAQQVSFYNVTGEFTAKAIIVSSGRLIDAIHQSYRASHPQKLAAYSDCRDKSGRAVSEYLSWKIPQFVSDNVRETTLVFNGVEQTQAMAVRNVLAKLTGVEQIRLAQLPTDTNKNAEYILVTGFIAPTAEEIALFYSEAVQQPVNLKEYDKFHIILDFTH